MLKSDVSLFAVDEDLIELGKELNSWRRLLGHLSNVANDRAKGWGNL